MSFGYPENQEQGQQGPPLEVSDFSGGKTDNFLDGPINAQKENDNLLIKENRKPRSRPGTVIFDTDNEQTPSGNNRIGEFLRTDDTLFSQVGRQLHFIDAGTFTTLFGPTGNPAFTKGDSNSHIAWSQWNKHYMMTNDDFSAPQKLFQDDTGTNRVVQAGLPAADLWSSIEFANDIKAQLNAHVQDVSGVGADHVSVQSAAVVTTQNAFDFESLVTLTKALLAGYDVHDDDAEQAGPTFHIAQEASDHSLTSLKDPISLDDVQERLNDLKVSLNAHDADGTAHTVGSLHQVTLFAEPQAAGTAGANNYVYTLVAFFEYKVGTVTFQDLGPTFQIQLTGIDSPDVNPVTISQIPDIVNGTTENYDTANIKWQVYRTQANGRTSTLTGTVDNGVTSFVDSNSDAVIKNNLSLYTDGGIVDNDPPPKSKYVVVINNSTWYGHTKIGDEEFPSRLYQSIQFDPDSVPANFFIDIEDEIKGLGAINIYPIVFCKDHIYRIENTIDELGNGLLEKREISRTIGSINHLSVVDAREGLFFAGNDGFYFTDGFKIKKLTDELDDSYRELIETEAQKERIIGEYEKLNDRIFWGVTESSASPDNDKVWVLDLKWGMRDNSTFTTLSNVDSWTPSALSITPDEKKFVIGDRRGFLFNFDLQIFTDPKIDLALPNADWQESAIIYDLEWIKTKFDTSYRRKWVTGIVVNMENVTNLSMLIQSENDNSGAFKDLKEVRFRDNITWGDETGPDWGDESRPFLWKTFPILSVKRRFPANRLRATYKSVRFTNSITILENSDNFGTATVDTTLKTVTLENVANSWPPDVVDQFMSFVNDDYEKLYLITARNSDTVLTYQDSTSSAPNGAGVKWQLEGVAKSEVFDMANFSIQWLPITPTHLPFSQSQSGENA